MSGQVKLIGPHAGEPVAILGNFDLADHGYLREEHFLAGDATAFVLDGEHGEDGRWHVKPGERAHFTTRFLVCRPEDPARFNGTVVLEWMNVSGGLDAAPDWFFLHRHLMREGAAWVGVSAQKVGIEGGGIVPGYPLKQADPERYASLVHPGDAFAYDVFTHVGRALREHRPLGPLHVERVIAVGESQSAGFLVSYVNAVDPVERFFDGFLIHGRGGTAAGLDGVYLRAPADGDLSAISRTLRAAHRVREDLRVPVLTVQSETDVVTLGGGRARQPDSERFHLWEIAGAAHFDTYGLIASHVDDGRLPVEELAERMAPTDKPMGMAAESLVNCGPQQHYVLQAALAALERQVRGGPPPPEAPRIETRGETVQEIVCDELGIARGGIRTPWVEAPTAVLSGLGQGGGGFSFLFGTTQLLPEAELARLYPGGAGEHLARFETATDAAVRAGFLLEADAEEIRALGRHGRQPSGFRLA